MYLTERKTINSTELQREVTIECFLPTSLMRLSSIELLILNDGQDMEKMGLANLLNELAPAGRFQPNVFIAAVFAGDRLMEFGTASTLDYMGRGYHAPAYTRFILHELIPFLKKTFLVPSFAKQSIAGFSLGGLSAIDIAWNHASEFSVAGVFSGSLWWRSKALDEGYDEATDRIMHAIIRNGKKQKGLRFYFEAGKLDETADRNHNGIIDSIDDTLDLILELERKGYKKERDIRYLELEDGRHDVETWGRAMPDFLSWAFPANPKFSRQRWFKKL